VGDRAGVVDLVGLHGGQSFGEDAIRAIEQANVVIGSRRHLSAVGDRISGRTVELTVDLDLLLEQVGLWTQSGEAVCLLASGDPGFFGLTRLAAARLGRDRVRVHPAPSAVAIAAARLGISWDDAVVVSAHGRPIEQAAAAVEQHAKVAVLVSPENPPEALGRLLESRGVLRKVAVVTHAGAAEETVWEGDVAALGRGRFDPMAVVVCLAPEAGRRGWAWGLPDSSFAHRDGMITKAEVRAVALGKLGLPASGVMWDVGAGSGAVAAECARLAPGLRVFAIEKRPDDARRIRQNLSGTAAVVVEGEAPGALAELPDPDRAFVGGGGLPVLEAVLGRLRSEGRVVATYASLERAAVAARILGSVVQVSVSRGVPIGDSFRLTADNPVFVCWGPD
jgi:precorrin-6Y C5,15-methyltransferase (decarboxylating)